MKDSLTKYFGVLGLLVYYPLAMALRVVVVPFLAVFILAFLLVWCPLTGKDTTPKWINYIYDWYCGK